MFSLSNYYSKFFIHSSVDNLLIIEICTKLNFTIAILMIVISGLCMFNSFIKSEETSSSLLSLILPFSFFFSFFIQIYIIYLFLLSQPVNWGNSVTHTCVLYNIWYTPFYSNLTIDLFGSVLIFLAYLIGFFSMLNFYDRAYWYNFRHTLLFNVFIIVVFVLVSCDDIYTFFIFYELLLLPSFILVYYSSPNKKGIQASFYFLVWTQLGSLLVYLAINQIVTITGSSSVVDIKSYSFNSYDLNFIKWLLFLGFGFKIPIWPFHYWLTKTHVEATGSFSMYLSGFLVKTALFGFYKFSLILNFPSMNIFFIGIALIGVIDASFKMWTQVDLKKLVAYCTIQEMNLIVLCFVFGYSPIVIIGILFCIMHAILSSLMFFLVDCIQRRYQSRHTAEVIGIIHTTPNLGLSIIAMVLLYLAVPGTLKFSCEFMLFCYLADISYPLAFILILSASSIAPISFARIWYGSVFGLPSKQYQLNNDLSHKELSIIYICILLLVFLSAFSYNFF